MFYARARRRDDVVFDARPVGTRARTKHEKTVNRRSDALKIHQSISYDLAYYTVDVSYGERVYVDRGHLLDLLDFFKFFLNTRCKRAVKNAVDAFKTTKSNPKFIKNGYTFLR